MYFPAGDEKYPTRDEQYKKAKKKNMCGKTYMERLEHAPESPNFRAFYVKFTKGAYTKWHYHTGEQLLLGTQGIGFVEFRGLPDVTLREGDRVIVPANVWHRHGAATQETFIHLAVTTGRTEWDEKDPCEREASK